MNNYYGRNSWADNARPSEILNGDVVGVFMQRVFAIMGFGLALTGATAYLFFKLIFIEEAGSIVGLNEQYAFIFTGPLRWVIMLAPLVIVFIMSGGRRRMGVTTSGILFAVFSVLMGISLSAVLAIYTSASVFMAFFITGGMFTAMAIYGITTKADLSKMGSILFMGLIGIIIASVANWFIGWETLRFAISVAGVIIFTGLTAYDVQRLMRDSLSMDANTEEAKKAAILGALALYLDFINLFIYILRLLGSRRN